ncbi:MAG TPA: hypothetical protein VFT51_04960 [Bacillales bacterium]|nr:hypothetical protein [Bacillales bacterium]
MRRIIRTIGQPKIYLAVILLIAFSLPLGGRAASAAGASPGFVIHSDRIEGEMMVPGVTIGPNGQPTLVFKYASATIHGLRLTNVVESPDGPITIIITASLVKAKNMTVRATGFSAGGACLKLGKTYPQVALKNVTLLAHHMEASQIDLQGLHVSVVEGAHGQQRPATSRVIQDLLGLPANALEGAIDDLLSGHIPLSCSASESDDENHGGGTDVSKKVEDVTDEVEKIIGGNGKPVEEMTEGAQGIVDKTTDDLGNAVNNTTDDLGNTIGGIGDQLGNTIGGPVGEAVENTGNAVGDIVGGTGDTVNNVVDEGKKTVDDVVNDVQNTVNDVVSGNIDDIPEDVGNTADHATEHTMQVSQELLDGVEKIGNQATDLLSDTNNTLDQLTLSELDGIHQDIQHAVQELGDLQTGLFGLLNPRQAEEPLNTLKNRLGDLEKKQGRLSDLQEKVRENQKQLQQYENRLGDLKDKVNSTFDQLQNRIRKTRDDIDAASEQLALLSEELSNGQKEIRTIASTAKEEMQQNEGLLSHLTGSLNDLLNGVNGLFDDLL